VSAFRVTHQALDSPVEISRLASSGGDGPQFARYEAGEADEKDVMP
jgi:hypothetical protein